MELPKADKDFQAYKRKHFNFESEFTNKVITKSDYKIDAEIYITVSYELLPILQCQWSQKAQHLWTYTIQMFEEDMQPLLPHLIKQVQFTRGEGYGQSHYI